ncbi:DUF4249 domain-containing protein [Chitinophaga sp. 22321]|uniref:DUF4249 domain-containing protein n=1 Tax=Chitinophaga hostae TaxID=2831022 RepID=A0ABS5J7U5_9BACT|nr:DUF4249 domain-containing protein [Chitinophaga hostae]MBS0031283.1 DUF4249 domain-containing protein [Chitinophaga hostae]
MNMKYFFVGAIGLVTLLTSCSKQVEIQLPYEGDKIVVNTLIQPDSVVYVRVTRSVPSDVFDDSGYKDIPGATVTLTEDGLPVAPMQVQEIKGLFWYVSQKKAVRGKQYAVAVAAPGLQSVTATDTLPFPPVIKNAAAQRNTNRVQFTLKDCPGTGDYYRIRIYVSDTSGEYGGFRPFRLDPAFNNNLVDFFTKSNYNSLVMTDERFDGKEVNFVLQTADPINSYSRVTVEVSTLTYNTWKYFSTVIPQKGDGGNIIIGSPVRVFTNVQNGYGIVGGINTRKLVFKVE